MSSASDHVAQATVVVPTFNGETYLEALLRSVLNQRFSSPFEVLVIDSGSVDGTLSIVRSFPEVRLRQISQSDFGHGRTRNMAVQMATSEFVVFLTHDAVPAHDRWLHELLAPFGLSNRVAAVMGAQVPRPDCFPLLKYEIKDLFASFGPGFGTTLFYDDDFAVDPAVRNALGFFSDVNSAVRRSVVSSRVPYRDVQYAEDQLLGRDLIDQGFIKAYAPRASVIHSNDLSLREYDNRMFDETVGLRSVGIDVDYPSLATIARTSGRRMVTDARRTLSDPEYSPRRRARFLALNPLFHVQKWRGVRRGVAADIGDEDGRSAYSLEAARRRSHVTGSV
jgi:rhamnosyltransferase